MIEEAVESLRATVLPNFMEPKSKLTKCKPAADSVYTILEKKMKSRLESHQLNSTGDSWSPLLCENQDDTEDGLS